MSNNLSKPMKIEDYRCRLCGYLIRVNDDGSEETCHLAHPDAEIDYDEHECHSIDMATNENIPKVAHILESEEKDGEQSQI